MRNKISQKKAVSEFCHHLMMNIYFGIFCDSKILKKNLFNFFNEHKVFIMNDVVSLNITCTFEPSNFTMIHFAHGPSEAF